PQRGRPQDAARREGDPAHGPGDTRACRTGARGRPIGRRADRQLPGRHRYPRSRETERTSLSCSTRARTLASWLSEATWSVARTMAVWSGLTATLAATMLTLASATTWV